MPTALRQNLRVLPGRFVLSRVTDTGPVTIDTDLLAYVAGPDGGAVMRREDMTREESADDSWVAVWNGDDAHDPDATGMLAAIVAPLASAEVPVWTAASFDGDLVMVPFSQLDRAVEVLRSSGHRVAVATPVDPRQDN